MNTSISHDSPLEVVATHKLQGGHIVSMILDGATPRARSTDPITSVDAGRAAEATMPRTQSQVLSLLFIEGALADHELVEYAGRWGLPGTPQKWRTARAQLVTAGLVEMVPNEFRPTENGYRAHVWRLANDTPRN